MTVGELKVYLEGMGDKPHGLFAGEWETLRKKIESLEDSYNTPFPFPDHYHTPWAPDLTYPKYPETIILLEKD
ncbi:MAG: hypothetical protein COA78_20445 [Blastopirellula sp.]|nr:MAG: hypothetical protein COA78_20445 [Blastopirellula sp.]